VRVKYLAQEHNTMSPARVRTRTARSGDERTNHEATAPPTGHWYNLCIDENEKLLAQEKNLIIVLDSTLFTPCYRRAESSE